MCVLCVCFVRLLLDHQRRESVEEETSCKLDKSQRLAVWKLDCAAQAAVLVLEDWLENCDEQIVPKDFSVSFDVF